MNFCYKSANIWQIVGYLFFIIKVVVPVIIIVLASIDFAQAVLSGEDKVVREKAERLFKRVLIGVAIFLIPTIIKVLFFNLPLFTDDMKNDIGNCIRCITSPYNTSSSDANNVSGCDLSGVNGVFSK